MSEAIKNMNDVSMAFTIPGPRNRENATALAAQKFEKATEMWKAGQYQLFGFLLGGLMRDLLLAVYPEQYHFVNHRLFARVSNAKLTSQLGDDTQKPTVALL